MQYILSQEELDALKKYDPDNLFNRTVNILNSIDIERDPGVRLRLFSQFTDHLCTNQQDGNELATLDAWEARKPGQYH